MRLVVDALCLILMLCVLVVVHEAGHAIVARKMGLRVSEFFIGMPYGPSVSFRSKRTGMRFGVSLALFGGYTRICGMAHSDDPRLPLVLQLVNIRGRISVAELSRVVSCSCEEALSLLLALEDLGSVGRNVDAARGSDIDYASVVFSTVDRDSEGLTLLDSASSVYKEPFYRAGESFDRGMSPDESLAFEKSRTYAGSPFYKRLIVLIAGPAANLLLSFLLIVSFLCTQTFYTVPDAITSIQQDSPAFSAGLEPGDVVVAINGQEINGYWELSDYLDTLDDDAAVQIAVDRGGEQVNFEASLAEGNLGVIYEPVPYRLSPVEAMGVFVPYVGQTVLSVGSLLNPFSAQEVLDSSTGVVGIASLANDAVDQGVWSVLLLAGMLSLSLCWMNLLPIPPLDGGKVLLEAISRVLGRPVPVLIQNLFSLMGMALFFLLFVYITAQDIGRLFM